jgi:hypothetical protein
MRGNTVEAYGDPRVSKTIEHLLDHLAVKSGGETIQITVGETTSVLTVTPDRFEAEARHLEEILRDYKAVYDGLPRKSSSPRWCGRNSRQKPRCWNEGSARRCIESSRRSGSID